MSGDEVSGDEVSGDEVSGDEVSGDEVSGDEVSGDEVKAEADARALRYAHSTLTAVCALLPHLSGLAGLVFISVDRRVDTACIFASGRMLVNPEWFLALSANDAIFVLAHELMHLALRSHERMGDGEASLFNIAHDFIINDMLSEELGCRVPAGGLELSGASQLSAERIVSDLLWQIDAGCNVPQPGWDTCIGAGTGTCSTGNPALADALRQAGLAPADAAVVSKVRRGDVLSEDLERQWFPDEDPRDVSEWCGDIRVAAARAIDLGVIRAQMEEYHAKSRGHEQGEANALVIALQAQCAPPWQQAIQQWVEAVMPGPRSYMRPSRRGADRVDVVLPGRKREGWILHLVLDTSGSMTDSLPMILGAIAAFCADMQIGIVHIVQCDVEVTVDECITPEDLANFTIAGFGGSDMTPAMMRLAQDPEVEVVIVLTDGWISYPATPMPYEVLWVLDYENAFSPPYGSVMALEGAVYGSD